MSTNVTQNAVCSMWYDLCAIREKMRLKSVDLMVWRRQLNEIYLFILANLTISFGCQRMEQITHITCTQFSPSNAFQFLICRIKSCTIFMAVNEMQYATRHHSIFLCVLCLCCSMFAHCFLQSFVFYFCVFVVVVVSFHQLQIHVEC